MSVLDRFVRIRRFRAQAAENYALAAESFGDSVRARYLAIADHYTALAEAELLSDKRERQFRLAEMQAKRTAALAQKAQLPAPSTPHPAAIAAALTAPARKLRLIKGDRTTASRHRIVLPARSGLIVAGVSKRER
ncbi:MAG TPA: hypothetical protein VHY10_02375 [Xanthobacteraceae bacterium]|jgi:hypothetical protein|nr:hypothetical protein [Xanthobacteraceae bacterium]